MIRCSGSFVDLILNEKMVYDYFCRENGCIAVLNHSLPAKVFKSADYAKRHRFFFKTALFLLDHVFFWMIRFVFLKKFLCCALKKTRAGRNAEPIEGPVLLCYAAVLPQMVQKSDLKENVSEYTALKPSAATPDYPGAKRQVTLIQAAGFGDFYRAYKAACREISNTRKAFGPEATYHALKAYEMHLTRIVLEKNPGITRLVYTNMADRWACLFSHMEGVERFLLQHGIIGRGPENLPAGRLGSVDALYLMSDAYLPHFRQALKHIGAVRKLTSDFAPVPCERRPGTIAVLLIANSTVDFPKEKRILEFMLQNPDKMTVYLKPHPRFPFSPYYELRKQYDFRLIEDKTFFPAADAVVSYVSTLAWEYELCDTPVFYYDRQPAEEIMSNLEDLHAKR